MIVKHYSQVEGKPFYGDGAEGVTVRPMIAGPDGAPTFALRYFEVAPGGHTPHHSHDWEHEIYIVRGVGSVLSADGPRPLKAGDVVFIPPFEQHQFRNEGDEPFVFTCAVPLRGHQ